MGIIIILFYVFFLAVPLYIIGKGIRRDVVVFTTIEQKKIEKIEEVGEEDYSVLDDDSEKELDNGIE